MQFHYVFAFVICPGVILAVITMLFLVNSWFRFGIEAGRIWLGGLVTTLISAVVGVGGAYALHLYSEARPEGDTGPEAGIIYAILAILVGIITLGMASTAFLRIAAPGRSHRGKRIWSGLIVAIGAPLLVSCVIMIFNH